MLSARPSSTCWSKPPEETSGSACGLQRKFASLEVDGLEGRNAALAPSRARTKGIFPTPLLPGTLGRLDAQFAARLHP